MDKDLDEAVARFRDVEQELNSSRIKLFSECDQNLFRSKNFDPYEICLRRYFLTISATFCNGQYNDGIEELLHSGDSRQRFDALKIINDCNLGHDFMMNVLPRLLDFAIIGNDAEVAISSGILTSGRVVKEITIKLLTSRMQQIIDKAEENSHDKYYIYQGVGYVMILLGATNLLKIHTDLCESSDDPEIRDLAADFRKKVGS